jgi:putative redox protein
MGIMNAKVTLLERMTFVGVADSGHEIRIDTHPEVGGDDSAIQPMELIALSLGSCTAMDVISILRKKKQDVTGFEVRLHMDREREHPRVFTKAIITYDVRGNSMQEYAVLRAIELSALKYCPAQAMLSKAFPMEFRYEIRTQNGDLIKEGAWEPVLV